MREAVCNMSDPASAAASPLEAVCSGAFPATSFEAAGVDRVAGSRAWVVLVVTAIAIILQNWILGLQFLARLAPFLRIVTWKFFPAIKTRAA
jgi:hypothetical protein